MTPQTATRREEFVSGFAAYKLLLFILETPVIPNKRSEMKESSANNSVIILFNRGV